MTRRELLQAVGAAAGVTALAGCSDAAARWGFSGNPDKAKVNLTYALWDGYEQIGYQKSVDEFTRAHPNISVTIQQIPYSSFEPKITSAYISGNAPDLFWVNTPFLANWIVQGLAADVTDRIKADNIDLSIYYPSLVELHRRNGRLYGLPKDWDTITFYYNKNFFKKIGVQPPGELSWNPHDGGSFLTFLKQLSIDGNGKKASEPGFDPSDIKTYALGVGNDPQSGYGSFLPDNGGNIIPHPYADHIILDSPENQQTFNFLLNTLADEHVLVPPQQMGPNGDGSNSQVLFAQGRISLYMAGDWNTSSLSQLGTGFEIGTIRLPAGPQGNYSVFNGLTDVINTDTPHPDETWELAKWLGGERSQAIMGSGGYIWPAIKKLDPLFLNYWRKKNVDVAAFLDAAQGKTVLWPVALGMGEAVTDFATELGPMFFGTKSIPEALADAQRIGDYRIRTTAQ
jgi:multiple sugar transport system substrate-binding protein